MAQGQDEGSWGCWAWPPSPRHKRVQPCSPEGAACHLVVSSLPMALRGPYGAYVAQE